LISSSSSTSTRRSSSGCSSDTGTGSLSSRSCSITSSIPPHQLTPRRRLYTSPNLYGPAPHATFGAGQWRQLAVQHLARRGAQQAAVVIGDLHLDRLGLARHFQRHAGDRAEGADVANLAGQVLGAGDPAQGHLVRAEQHGALIVQ